MDDSTGDGNRGSEPNVDRHGPITLYDLLAYVAPDAAQLINYLLPKDEFQLSDIVLRTPDDRPIVDVTAVRMGSRLEVYLSDEGRDSSDFISRLPGRRCGPCKPRGRNNQRPETRAHDPQGNSCIYHGRGPLLECPDCGPRDRPRVPVPEVGE